MLGVVKKHGWQLGLAGLVRLIVVRMLEIHLLRSKPSAEDDDQKEASQRLRGTVLKCDFGDNNTRVSIGIKGRFKKRDDIARNIAKTTENTILKPKNRYFSR